MNFYVIENSDENSDSVTMLKAEPLTVDEVNKYGKDHVDMLVYGTKSHLIPYLFKFTYNCIKSYVLFKKIK